MIYFTVLSSILLWLTYFHINNRNFFTKDFNVKVDLNFFFAIAYLLYGLIPSVILLFNEQKNNLEFIFNTQVMILCILIGYIVFELFSVRNKSKALRIYNNYLGFFKLFLLILFTVFILDYYIETLFTSWELYFTQKYGKYNVSGVSSLTSLIPFLLLGIWVSITGKSLITNSFNRKLIFLTVLIIGLIFIIGGNRNIGIMFVFILFFAKYFDEKINLFKFLSLIFLGIIFAAVLAVYREYGIINIILGTKSVEINDVIRYITAYNEGEFGTMYRVLNYYMEFNGNFDVVPLFSYIFSPIVNLIPTFIYPNRPDTISTLFTYAYWGGSSDFIEGLGFSPIVEAKMNLSSFWWIIFIIFGYLLNVIQFISMSYLSNINKYLLLVSLSIPILNFFRIDFALYIKFVVIIWISSLLTNKFLLKKF